jgi:NADPH-dependent F420 reductase
MAQMNRIAILGGTGPEGFGLALRFSLAGNNIIIGSRRQERAQEAARLLNARLVGFPVPKITSAHNAAAAEAADIVALTLPFDGIEPVLSEVAPVLSGKIVLDVVNPVRLSDGVFTASSVAEGSAAEFIQRLLPTAPVVSALKNRSAHALIEIDQTLQGDSLVCSNTPGAARTIEALINSIPRLRAVNAGPLRNARYLESLTALLLNLNRRYHTNTALQILGLKIPCQGSTAESAQQVVTAMPGSDVPLTGC